MTLNRIELSDLLVARVGESDLRAIVFRLGLRYEHLAGVTLAEKILSLIQYCEDRQRYADLLQAIGQARADLRTVLFPSSVQPAPQPPADTETQLFDVFLAHNNQDKPHVEQLANLLRARGIHPWLDKEQIAPGRWFQDAIQAVIPRVKSAAIIIGPGGLGRWQALELRTLVSQCVENGKPVIPLLLPGVDTLPEALLFLKELHRVKFHHTMDEPAVLDDLIWGISGHRSGP